MNIHFNAKIIFKTSMPKNSAKSISSTRNMDKKELDKKAMRNKTNAHNKEINKSQRQSKLKFDYDCDNHLRFNAKGKLAIISATFISATLLFTLLTLEHIDYGFLFSLVINHYIKR